MFIIFIFLIYSLLGLNKMGHASQVIAAIYKITGDKLKFIDREIKTLAKNNLYPDLLGEPQQNDVKIKELRRDAGIIQEIRMYFEKKRG